MPRTFTAHELGLTREQLLAHAPAEPALLKRQGRGRKPKRTTRPDSAGPFRALCKLRGLPMPETEHRFAAPDRQWRFDFAWADERVALEVEGGVWTKGRHTRGSGFVADIEKYNAATLRGWRVFRCTPKQLLSDATIGLIAAALGEQFTIRVEAQSDE